MPLRFWVLSLIALLPVGHLSAAEPLGQQLSWDGVLEAAHRSAENRQRDRYRHPLETLTFFSVQPCDVVVEIWPGGGWYSEILAPVLKDCGKLYAAHFRPDSKVEFFRRSRQAYENILATHPEVYSQVTVTSLEPPEAITMAPPGSADKVLTFRNVHNWLKAGTAQAVFDSAFAALKPGGIFGVVEHRASPGTSLQKMIESGYVTEEKVIALAEAAGFLLLDESELNANPKDDHDHPAGVWTLPPRLRLGDEQREHYLAIGESDRMTLKFGKPVHER